VLGDRGLVSITAGGGIPESEIPFPLYPHVPGLLPWGTYGDVDVLGWLTNADSGHWRIVYKSQYEGYFELTDYGFVQFLVSAIQGTTPLPKHVMGNDIITSPRTFVPF
jgi:hypothetical protein